MCCDVVFRVENIGDFYIPFDTLKPFLTESAMQYNKKEGNHWKLYIYRDHVQIRGNPEKLFIKPNEFNAIEKFIKGINHENSQ